MCQIYGCGCRGRVQRQREGGEVEGVIKRPMVPCLWFSIVTSKERSKIINNRLSLRLAAPENVMIMNFQCQEHTAP